MMLTLTGLTMKTRPGSTRRGAPARCAAPGGTPALCDGLGVLPARPRDSCLGGARRGAPAAAVLHDRHPVAGALPDRELALVTADALAGVAAHALPDAARVGRITGGVGAAAFTDIEGGAGLRGDRLGVDLARAAAEEADAEGAADQSLQEVAPRGIGTERLGEAVKVLALHAGSSVLLMHAGACREGGSAQMGAGCTRLMAGRDPAGEQRVGIGMGGRDSSSPLS